MKPFRNSSVALAITCPSKSSLELHPPDAPESKLTVVQINFEYIEG